MKIFLVVLMVVFILIFGVLFSKSSVEIKYNNKKLILIIRCLFVKFKITPNTFKHKNEEKKESGSEAERNVSSLKEKYKKYKKLIDIFLDSMDKRIRIEKLELDLKYGTGDAATTGMLYGVVWAMISGVYKHLTKFFDLEFPRVNISPDFQNSFFDFKFCGILKVRLVHIINTLYKIYLFDKEQKKKGADDNV